MIEIDNTDIEIIKLLAQNSRLQWQEIGDIVHFTGQAVRNRIKKLEKLGIIEGYTVKLNPAKLGMEITAFVTVFMKTTDHMALQNYIRENELIIEAYRVSGEGCYWLKVYMGSQSDLIDFLDGLLRYGNYKVNLAIDKLK